MLAKLTSRLFCLLFCLHQELNAGLAKLRESKFWSSVSTACTERGAEYVELNGLRGHVIPRPLLLDFWPPKVGRLLFPLL